MNQVLLICVLTPLCPAPQNLCELLARQQRLKYYQQAKDGKYTMLCRTPQVCPPSLSAV